MGRMVWQVPVTVRGVLFIQGNCPVGPEYAVADLVDGVIEPLQRVGDPCTGETSSCMTEA
jgi:hypothetical protein